jgi:hypothetical protein
LSAAAASPFITAFEQINRARAIGKAEHLPHVLRPHAPAACAIAWSNERSDHRAPSLPSARSAPALPAQPSDGFLLGLNAQEVLHQPGGVDATQIEALAARQHRHRTFLISVVAKIDLACGGGSSERLEQRS